MEFRNVPHLNRLVIAAPNWLGDAVMALPAVADIRRTWADARLTVAARPAIAPLFSLVNGVDDVVELPGATATGVGAAEVLRGFDAAVLLPNSFHIALAARRAGIPERWGYRADWRGPLLTRAIAPPRGVHQAKYYQHLAAELGCVNGQTRPEIELSDAVRFGGAESLRRAGWDGRSPLVALAPGAAYGGAKKWPAGSFRAVATGLWRDGITSVLVGAPADKGAGTEVEAGAGIPIINLIGKTDLPGVAGVLAACRGLITNDSGAMHLAAALGIPVTAMFGPTRETETFPLASARGAEPVVLVHDVWCRPCMLRECPLTHRCMRGITSDAVLTAARRAL